jgi:hypothetical protein
VIPETKAEELIGSSQGRFFRVQFVKRTTGEIRTMIARTGVHRHLRGGSLSYSAPAKRLAVVWDVTKKDYRTVPLDAVLTFQCGKVKV